MSIQLTDHEDLKKLKDEGYQIDIINGHLVMYGIPYVTNQAQIDFGVLYCKLNIAGNGLCPPSDHTARFIGEHPCNQFGEPDNAFVNNKVDHRLSEKLAGNYYFSSKPASGRYTDYYSKMSRYVQLLSNPARSIDQSISPKNFDFVRYQEESVFEFGDSYSARAGISEVNARLEEYSVAIIGLGGTGAHLLDHLSKTNVKKISLFDGDTLQNHNLFRMPGAIVPSDLEKGISKVEFLEAKYSRFRKNIFAHDVFLSTDNLDLLNGHDFVFVSIDDTEAKRVIIDWLLKEEISFIDLGMGLSKSNGSIRGQVRGTLVTSDNKAHIDKINMNPMNDEDIYSQNIQISELNALNAIQGIIIWKKMCGVYSTDLGEYSHSSVYVISEGELANEA